MTAKREWWLDYLKVFGMFLIVWGHFFPEGVSCFIYSVNVPLFFWISGYLYKPYEFKTLVHKTVRTLVIPYLVLAFFNLFISFLLGRIGALGLPQIGRMSLLQNSLGILTGRQSSVGPLWFVYALAIVKILSFVADRKLWLRVILGIAFLCLALYIHMTLDVDSLKNILLCVPISYVFFESGRICRSCKLVNMPSPVRLLSFLPAAFLFYFFSRTNGNADLFVGRLGNAWWKFAIASASGLYILVNAFKMMNLKPSSFVYVSSIGTIVTLAEHVWLNKICSLFLDYSAPLYWLWSALFSILILVVCYLMILFVRRYAPVVIGWRK